jgi:hypothetical protein
MFDPQHCRINWGYRKPAMFAQHTTPFGTKVEQVVVELHSEGLLHLSLKREIHAIRSIIPPILTGGLRR